MPNEWLAPQEAAELLGCSAETVRAMLDDGLFSGKKVKGEWWVNAVEVEWIQTRKPSGAVRESSRSSSLLKVDPGMVEVSVALSGVAAAIAAILTSIPVMAENLRFFVALLAIPAGILAVFSAYSALWLLARYCCPEIPSLLGFKEIAALLTSPVRTSPKQIGPYWLVGWGLVVWLVLSILIGALAVVK